MRNFLAAALVAVGLFAGAEGVQAQGMLPLSIEARGGFAVPTGEWNEDDEVDNGWGYGVSAQLQVMPMLGVYAGWERYSFGLDEGEDDVEADAVDQGFRAGVELSLPLAAATGLRPFLIGGAIYNHLAIEASGDGASVEVESDDALGFEVGAGVAVPLGPTLSFTPAVRYRSHSAEFEAFGEQDETTVSYVSLDLGLRFGF